MKLITYHLRNYKCVAQRPPLPHMPSWSHCLLKRRDKFNVAGCAEYRYTQNIFILVINQLDAQNLFYSKFISCLYMFGAPCAHRQEVKIYYTASGIITRIGGRPVHGTATYT